MLSRSAALTFSRRLKSTYSPSCHPLKSDEGNLATHTHHRVTTALAVLTPVYLLLPLDSKSLPSIPAQVDQGASLILSSLISIHSWIGLNYVVTDYIPKFSKTLVGPARTASAAMALVTLIGLGKISLQNEKGLRGLIWNGLWSPKKKNTK